MHSLAQVVQAKVQRRINKLLTDVGQNAVDFAVARIPARIALQVRLAS